MRVVSVFLLTYITIGCALRVAAEWETLERQPWTVLLCATGASLLTVLAA